jgi:ABC-type sugar transport system substrate-binding protein
MPVPQDHTRNAQSRGKGLWNPSLPAVLFAAAVASCLIGCDARGPQHRSQAQPLRVGIITPVPGLPTAGGYRDGFEKYAAGLPTLRLYWFRPTDGTPDALDDALRSARDAGVQALVAYVETPESAERVAAFSLPAATFGPIEASGAGCGHVYLDYPDAAEQLGRHLADLAPDARSYLLLHRESAGGWHERAYRRFVMQADLGRMRRLSQSDLGTSPLAEARDAVDALLADFPAAPLIVSLEPSPWIVGPARPLGDGRQFVTVGAVPALWPFLREGAALAIAGPLEPEAAETALRLACECLNDSHRHARLRTQSPEIVTRENLDDFISRYTGK